MDAPNPFLNNNGAISKLTIPIYAPHNFVKKTSAEIIREARETINKDAKQSPDSSFTVASIKPVNTQRPFTPKDKERILFGKALKSSRPPSSFSLKYLQFETPDYGGGASQFSKENVGPTKSGLLLRHNSFSKLQNKTDRIFNLSVEELPVRKIKLPSMDSNFKPALKRAFRSTNSLENLPEESDFNHSESIAPKIIAPRNAYSSPKENTDESNKNIFGPNIEQQILEPRNLTSLFANKQIVNDSENLFTKSAFEQRSSNRQFNSNLNFFGENTKPQPKPNTREILTVQAILEKLNSEKITDDLKLIDYLEQLYKCLEIEEYIFNSKRMSSKLKITILKCLYKYVERPNEKLLLNIARIILAIRVTGSNLSGVCKLVFKVSRDDKNDYLFLHNNILELFLESLGSASPLEDTEALIYGYGAIKFLTMNAKVLEKILNQGVLQLMILHIKIINNARLEKTTIPEQTSHVLYQLTGALRNLASVEKIYEDLVDSGAIKQLCQSIELFMTDVDVIGNISRTLSIISTHDECCECLMDNKNIFTLFLNIFDKYPGKQDMVVRLGYTIGNLVAKLDHARHSFFYEERAIDTVLNMLEIYLKKDLKQSQLQTQRQKNTDVNSNDVGGSNGSVEDVIVKMIRIIANIAINSKVGKLLINNYGEKLVDVFLVILLRKTSEESEELVLSVLSTLNNLSYYYSPENEQSVFHKKQLDLSNQLCRMVNSENKDCVIEAVRVLGNLSRSKITRDFILETGSFSKLMTMFDKDDPELLRTTIGVFVNMMADTEKRILFKNDRGVSRLLTIFARHGETDWPLSTLVCQVLWNFSIDSTNLYQIITENELNQLLGLLIDYLDEERIFGINEETSDNITDIVSSQEYIYWDEFATVATNLLEKIENFLDGTTPVDISDFDDSSDDNDVFIVTAKNLQPSGRRKDLGFNAW